MERRAGITRREALGLGAASAIGAALALSGCSAGTGEQSPEQGESYVDFDLEGEMLPLGSVVVLDDGCDSEVDRLVVARRPVCLQEDHVYDYAGIVWPIGFISDVSGAPLENEVHLFDSAAVKGVRFLGYAGPLENTAASELKDARAAGESALEALLPLAAEMGVIEPTGEAGATDGR